MSYLLSNVLFLVPVAAFLGGLIGWFARRIISVRRKHAREEEVQARLKGRDTYISQLKLELNEAEEGIELQNSALQKSLEERGEETREQRGLSDEYLVRMRAAESKLINLQRNYLVFKTQKQREINELQSNLKSAQPLRVKLQKRIELLERNAPQVDMDATLEIDPQMTDEQNPFILRNALVSEKRKVEKLLLVKKELGDTYFRFAEQKQLWLKEKQALATRISELENTVNNVKQQETLAQDIMRGDFKS